MRQKYRPNRRVEKRRFRLRHLLVALTALAVAILAVDGLQATPPPPLPRPAPETEESQVEEAPMQPRGPRALPATVLARAVVEDLPLREDELVEGVHADAFFVLESERALGDLRMRLFDAADRLVPSDETVEIGRGTRYTLVPKEALQAGATYTLTVEGQEGDRPTDVSGQAFLPARFTFVVARN